ncbi:MAG: glutaminyl-peptide cyclotransferase [gamma proteobacterium symbiont of Taylorina sp.]|nr:glutaminyl-peptide cyclotransferase [gamma proteobacterium symbiont of Taylorina sp.]
MIYEPFRFLIFLSLFMQSLVCLAVPSYSNPEIADYEIINIYPHDRTSFTQGLCFDEGVFYEGTGLYGKSKLLKKNLAGKTLATAELQNHFWGEGVTIVNDQIIQLTWKAGIGFVRDKNDIHLKVIKTFSYEGEGWGLTYDGQWLIMSNGSSILSFLYPDTFLPHHQIIVKDNITPVKMINELEYIEGEIWANVWKSTDIIRINPQNGQVISRIDLSSLARDISPPGRGNVLNGIAYDVQRKRIFITGKRWPFIIEIKTLDR